MGLIGREVYQATSLLRVLAQLDDDADRRGDPERDDVLTPRGLDEWDDLVEGRSY